jgi:hypothetical protein
MLATTMAILIATNMHTHNTPKKFELEKPSQGIKLQVSLNKKNAYN